jgi:hypothetical protein
MKRQYFISEGWLICEECNHPLHSRFRYFRGWLAWTLVCRWWPTAWGLPPLLAYAGDCIFDCRSLPHG